MTIDWMNTVWIPAGIYSAFFVLERAMPKSKTVEKVPRWWEQVSLLVVLRFIAIVAFIPVLSAIATSAVLPKGGLIQKFWPNAAPFAVSAIVLLTYTFFHYWSHRFRHQAGVAWRLTHQMHHSPNRFDLSLSVFVHPFDVAFIMCVMFFSVYVVCGFSAENLTLLGIAHSVLDKPMHLNVRTPRALGYFLFRPEQHSLHHETHDTNYGLIPLWDMLFGTFKNCDAQAEAIGFPDRPSRFREILFCKKVW